MRRVLIVAALAALPIACRDETNEPLDDLATRVHQFLATAGIVDLKAV
jgi:hypothetical protein